MTPSASLGRAALATLLALLVLACSDLMVTPAPTSSGLAGLSLSLSAGSSGQAARSNAEAFDRADGVHVRLLHADSAIQTATVALSATSAVTRIRIPVEEQWAGKPLQLQVELRLGPTPLFRGATPVTLRSEGENATEVPLEPVAAGIRLPESLPSLTALGDGGTLAGAVLFATGDTIRGATVAWRSLTPAILEVSPQGSLVALDEGEGRLEGTFGSFTDTLTLQVRAEVDRVEVTPGEITLTPGESRVLAATARDVRGNALRRTVTWSSTAPNIAVVESGTVRAVEVGMATVTATTGEQSGSATVSVVNPVPLVSGVQPDGVLAGSPAFKLTVTGSGFVPESQIHWDGSARPTDFVGPGELQASIPESDVLTAGAVAVTVVNPAPGGGTSEAATLSVENPLPVLERISPREAVAGDDSLVLTVNGSGYVAGSEVTWNDAALPTRVVSPTRLEAEVSTEQLRTAATAVVGVRNPQPGGGVSGTERFHILAPASIRLSTREAAFTVSQLAATPAPEMVAVTNGGDEALQELTAEVRYTNGDGWLSAALDRATAPATLTLQPTTTDLPVGTYTATVTVRAQGVATPMRLEVRYEVSFAPSTLYRADGDYQDSGGAGNHASPQGVVGFDESFSGQAFKFSGPGQAGEITAPEQGAIATAEAVTLATWVQLGESESGGGVRRFVTLQPERAVLRLDGQFGGASGAGANSLHFYVNTGSGPVAVYADGVLSQRGCWYHVAGTYDGTTVRLYRNGEQVASSVGGGRLNPGTGEGIRLSNADAGGLETLDGLLDDVRILPRAVSRAEVEQWASEADDGAVCTPLPDLTLSTQSASFTAVTEVPAPDSQTVEIGSSDESALRNLTAAVDEEASAWLTASLSGSTTPATLTLQVDHTNLESGTYAASVEVSSPDAANSPQFIDVSLIVSEALAYYRAEGNYQDSVGESHGTPVGVVAFDSGYTGQAFRFSGVEQPGGIAAPQAAEIASAEHVTLAAWVNFDENEDGNGVRRFITLGPERASLRLDFTNSLNFFITGDDGVRRHLYASGVLSERGCWYHVAGTYDGAMLRLYLDGTEVERAPYVGTVMPADGEGVALSSAAEPMDGLLDEVRIYGRAMSETEIGSWASAAGDAGASLCREQVSS